MLRNGRIASLCLSLMVVWTSWGKAGPLNKFEHWTLNPATGHVCALTKAGTTWTQGEADAVAAGGHLVTINDAAENTWVSDTFRAYHDSGGAWIGFNDVATEGTWVWSSGQAASYTHWAGGQPDDSDATYGGEDHGKIYGSSTGDWGDNNEQRFSWKAIYEGSAPAAWTYNPNTNRYYTTIAPNYWEDAQAYATSIGSHIVTVNDDLENAYVLAQFASQGSPYLWIGIKNQATPATGPWQWAEGGGAGGTFTKGTGGDSYTNWAGVEPNGDGPYTMMYVSGTNVGKWNDVPGTRDYRPVLEKDAEVPTWVLNPANGHLYTVIANATHGNNWNAAEAIAQRWGAHLVTVNDAAESAWINSEANLPTGSRPYKYIGMHNPAGDNKIYVWASGTGGYWDASGGPGMTGGTGTSYANWRSIEPSSTGEQAIMIYASDGGWNDVSYIRDFPALVEADGRSPIIYSPVTGKGYCYLPARMTWEQANQFGQALDLDIAEVGSAAENAWLRSTFAAMLGDDVGLWLGLSDALAEGTWEWNLGGPLAYTNWAPGNPIGGDAAEDYAFMYLADGLWRDRDGVNLFYPLYQIPEPATCVLLAGGLAGILARRRRRA